MESTWFVLAITVALLWLVKEFIRVYKRNQVLAKLPTLGGPWILGGYTLPLFYRFMIQGNQGLYTLMNDSVTYSEKLGSKIYVSFIGWLPFVVIQEGEIVREVCTKTDGIVYKKNFGYDLSRPLLGDSLLISSGAFWKHQRKMFDPGFAVKQLNRATVIIDELIKEQSTIWENQAKSNNHVQIQVFTEMLRITADTIAMYAFTKRFQGTLSHSFNIVLNVLGWKIWEDPVFPFFKYVPTYPHVMYWIHLRKLKNAITAILKERVNMPPEQRQNYNDLLSVVVADADANSLPMSYTQLRDEFIGLVFAGHDTTASTLSWSFHLLAEHQDMQQRLYNEIAPYAQSESIPSPNELEKLEYLGAFVNEVLRVYPPAIIGRSPIEPTQLAGYELPVGSEIFINLYAMHHHKSVWGEDADEFNPDRFMKPLTSTQQLNFLPFGGAPRVCIGKKLALIEIKLVLIRLLGKFRITGISKPKLLPSLTLHPTDYEVALSLRSASV